MRWPSRFLPKNPFSEIDPVIEACVLANGSTLFRNLSGQPTRFFHLPGDPPFECLQIVIERPVNGCVVVCAYAIDTNDGTEDEMEQVFEGPVGGGGKPAGSSYCNS